MGPGRSGSDSRGPDRNRRAGPSIGGHPPASPRGLTDDVEAWTHLRVVEVYVIGRAPLKQKLPCVHTPTLSAPLRGGSLDRVGPPALPVAARPFRPLISRLPCTGQLNGPYTVRDKGTPHREPPCPTCTAAHACMWSL